MDLVEYFLKYCTFFCETKWNPGWGGPNFRNFTIHNCHKKYNVNWRQCKCVCKVINPPKLMTSNILRGVQWQITKRTSPTPTSPIGADHQQTIHQQQVAEREKVSGGEGQREVEWETAWKGKGIKFKFDLLLTLYLLNKSPLYSISSLCYLLKVSLSNNNVYNPYLPYM
jgi:hypothetical protein